MTGSAISIALTGIPSLIKDGLVSAFKQHLINYKLIEFEDLHLLSEYTKDQPVTLIIIDAGLFPNGFRILNNIRKELSKTPIIAIQYQYINQNFQKIIDGIIKIDDSAEEAVKLITTLVDKYETIGQGNKSEFLSEREIDVLKLLVTGNSGKEVAEKLNISINTVITHRKNISQKTGIKSLAGLTIYAVTNRIISMKNI